MKVLRENVRRPVSARLVRMPALSSVCVLSLIFAGILFARPLQSPLSFAQVREAYSLGKSDSRARAAFFAPYTVKLLMPKSGPHVALIRLETPFAFVVERTADSLADYRLSDADREFLGKAPLLRLYVRIDPTPSYPSFIRQPDGTTVTRRFDFWRDFRYKLFQGNAEIPAESTETFSSREIPVEYRGHAPTGASVELKYDADKIRSAPVRVEVLTPDGQRVEAPFDLSKLR